MAEIADDYVPKGDPARHRSRAELESGLARLPAAAADAGRVRLIVRRCEGGVRETPAAVVLTPQDGVPGDRWGRVEPRNGDAQLAIMRCDVAELIANGQPLTLFGDNLFVDLDLSQASLPIGSTLRVGAALVEVTPKPHNGCIKFKGRFGQDALFFVQAPETRNQNRRGIYWKVVEAGEAQVGDPIEVVRRSPPLGR